MKLYFTEDEILMGREVQNPLTTEMERNLRQLIIALSKIREAYGKPLSVSSGYRPSSINQSVGGAKYSAHQSCQAVDIIDNDGLFANWCLNNLTILEEAGIFMEDPRYTVIYNTDGSRKAGWVHLQIRATKSGNRVFIPSVNAKVRVE